MSQAGGIHETRLRMASLAKWATLLPSLSARASRAEYSSLGTLTCEHGTSVSATRNCQD